MNAQAMFIIMIISGFLSTMNIWTDKWSNVRLHLNDLYMVLLMTGWMFLLSGLYMKSTSYTVIGSVLVIVCLYLIRTQSFIDPESYVRAMIPHHSMAVFMSKELRNKGYALSPALDQLTKDIIDSQEKEIDIMKRL